MASLLQELDEAVTAADVCLFGLNIIMPVSQILPSCYL